MANTAQHYTAQRAELLAHLVLTRRKDVRILSLGDKDDFGIDLIAHILKPIEGIPATPYFGVQVKGTSNPVDDEKLANRLASHFHRSMTGQSFILAPVILMLFAMEGDRGYWGWVMQPFVGGPNSPALTRTERIEMRPVNNDTLDTLFSSVVEWFQAIGNVLRRNNEGI